MIRLEMESCVLFYCLHLIDWEFTGVDKELEYINMGSHGLLAKGWPAYFIQKYASHDMVLPIIAIKLMGIGQTRVGSFS